MPVDELGEALIGGANLLGHGIGPGVKTTFDNCVEGGLWGSADGLRFSAPLVFREGIVERSLADVVGVVGQHLKCGSDDHIEDSLPGVS